MERNNSVPNTLALKIPVFVLRLAMSIKTLATKHVQIIYRTQISWTLVATLISFVHISLRSLLGATQTLGVNA